MEAQDKNSFKKKGILHDNNCQTDIIKLFNYNGIII